MDFTDSELEILFRAWRLAQKGRGQVLAPEKYPEAVTLADAGWLERRYVDATGDWAWFWTPQAETALNVGPLRRDHWADMN